LVSNNKIDVKQFMKNFTNDVFHKKSLNNYFIDDKVNEELLQQINNLTEKGCDFNNLSFITKEDEYQVSKNCQFVHIDGEDEYPYEEGLVIFIIKKDGTFKIKSYQGAG